MHRRSGGGVRIACSPKLWRGVPPPPNNDMNIVKGILIRTQNLVLYDFAHLNQPPKSKFRRPQPAITLCSKLPGAVSQPRFWRSRYSRKGPLSGAGEGPVQPRLSVRLSAVVPGVFTERGDWPSEPRRPVTTHDCTGRADMLRGTARASP